MKKEQLDKHLANIKQIQKELAMQHAKDKEADYVDKMNKRKKKINASD